MATWPFHHDDHHRHRLRPVGAALGRGALGLVHFFFPRLCNVCLERLDDADCGPVCGLCLKALSATPRPLCPWCGAGMARIDPKTERCPACPRPRHFDAARGAVGYGDTAREMTRNLKFRGHRELAPVMARYCHGVLEREWAFEQPDAMVPVPLHPTRRRERGFNQSEDLAREIGRLSGLPLAPELLERVRPTPAQSRLTQGERKRNVRGAFLTDRRHDLAGRTILLVDDVMTSSATVNECARALKEAGARQVLILVFARAGTGR